MDENNKNRKTHKKSKSVVSVDTDDVDTTTTETIDNINEQQINTDGDDDLDKELSDISSEIDSDDNNDDENGPDPVETSGSLSLIKWDPTELKEKFKKEGNHLIFQGKTGSGKTYMFLNLFNNYISPVIDYVFVISESEKSLDEYKDGLNVSENCEKFLYKGNMKDLAKPLTDRILMIHQMFKEHYKYQCRTMLILDDCVNIESDRYNKALRDIFINGRKNNISCVYLCQSNRLSDTVWKTNCNYFINFGIINARERKTFIENSLNGLANKDIKQWTQIFLEYAKNRQALVIDQSTNETDFKKIIKYYSV